MSWCTRNRHAHQWPCLFRWTFSLQGNNVSVTNRDWDLNLVYHHGISAGRIPCTQTVVINDAYWLPDKQPCPGFAVREMSDRKALTTIWSHSEVVWVSYIGHYSYIQCFASTLLALNLFVDFYLTPSKVAKNNFTLVKWRNTLFL